MSLKTEGFPCEKRGTRECVVSKESGEEGNPWVLCRLGCMQTSSASVALATNVRLRYPALPLLSFRAGDSTLHADAVAFHAVCLSTFKKSTSPLCSSGMPNLCSKDLFMPASWTALLRASSSANTRGLVQNVDGECHIWQYEAPIRR